jgi:hypothetical protein
MWITPVLNHSFRNNKTKPNYNAKQQIRTEQYKNAVELIYYTLYFPKSFDTKTFCEKKRYRLG